MTITEFCNYYKITKDHYYGNYPIFGDLYLMSTSEIPKGFNPFIIGDLIISKSEYWPKGFKPKVQNRIFITLKSPTLSKLLRYSSTRKLAYNLLDTL